ncbi:MAG: protein kinase, partial [Planctomycetes bacterium]|nr:protein kinase [Planctomycetota bacterium]
LAYSHEHGILHRDVKPSNILLGIDGRARLTDFGLAKSTGSQDLTKTGEVVGTLRYMPPERFLGRSDVRGDVYSLGLVLYELVTLRWAFDEVSRTQMLAGRAGIDLPRARHVNPGVTEELETIIGKATAIEPERRYESATALSQDLRAFLDGRAIAARDPSLWYLLRVVIRRNKVASTVAAVSFVLLLAGAISHVLSVTHERDVANQARELASARSYAANVASTADALRRGDAAQAQMGLRVLASERGSGWEQDYLSSRANRSSWTSPRRETHYQGLVVDPDGRRLFAVLNQDLECWNLDTHELEFTLRLQDDQCSNVVLHPNGKELAVAGERQNAIRIVDIAQRRVVRTLQGHSDQVRDIAYLRGGARLVSVGWDGVATVWDTAAASPLRTFSPRGQWLHDVEVDPSGKRVALCGGGCVALWDADSLRVVKVVELQGADVRRACFTSDGRQLLVSCHSGEQRLLSVPDLVEERRWRDLERVGNAVACDPLGEYAACGGSDGRLVLRRFDDAQPPDMLGGHTGELTAVCFTPDGSRIYSAAWDGCIREWSVARSDLATLVGHYAVVSDIDVDSSGSRLVSSSDDGTLRVWDLHSRAELAVHLPWSAAGRLDMDLPGKLVAAACGRLVLVYDVQRLEPVRYLRCSFGVNDVAVSSQGAVAAVGPRGSLVVWSGVGFDVVAEGETGPDDVAAVAFAPHGDRVAVGTARGEVGIWSINPLHLEQRIAAHSDSAFALDWATPEVLVSGGSDLRICYWSSASGALMAEVDVGSDLSNRVSQTVYSVRHLPSVERVVAITTGLAARLWDSRSGRAMLSLDLGANCWTQAATPDGALLAFGLVDGRIRLFERDLPGPEAHRRAAVARRARDRVRPRVAQAFSNGVSVERVLDELSNDANLVGEDREAALALARCWLGSPDRLLPWVEERLRRPAASYDDALELEAIVYRLTKSCRSNPRVHEPYLCALRAAATLRANEGVEDAEWASVVSSFQAAETLFSRAGIAMPAWQASLFVIALARAGEIAQAKEQHAALRTHGDAVGEIERVLLAEAAREIDIASRKQERR